MKYCYLVLIIIVVFNDAIVNNIDNDEVVVFVPHLNSLKILEELYNADLTNDLNDEEMNDELKVWQKCDNDLSPPHGIKSYFDFDFFKKLIRNLSPFSTPIMQMRFYLFRREFAQCGKEMKLYDDSFHTSRFKSWQPTRIIVHGWMSQSRGSFNRDVKNAYLARGDFNVIVVDWSASAANLNYFSVVKMIEGFGAQLAKFTKYLHNRLGVVYDDIYIIGHSLGAQIAGAAGKRIKPAQYNTIFALDPAGPKFRRRSVDFRIDPTDAKYVESIQTSGLYLGFLDPTGNATFYPNYGLLQKRCFFIGCSHIRAYKMFAESIISKFGFWGARCFSRKPKWSCENNKIHRMGGEPSTPKSGLFYVQTKSQSPYAKGKYIQINFKNLTTCKNNLFVKPIK